MAASHPRMTFLRLFKMTVLAALIVFFGCVELRKVLVVVPSSAAANKSTTTTTSRRDEATTIASSASAQQEAAKSSNSSSSWRQDSARVANTNVTYRFPIRSFEDFDDEYDDEQILCGVMSSAWNFRKRSIIRKMWAYRHGNVFFVVGGEWTQQVQNEFETFGDLIWVDQKETYRGVVWKTMTMFVAFQKHVGNYRHILKTDDDSYVRLGLLERLSAGKHVDSHYWGWCNSNTPVIRKEKHRWAVSKQEFEPDVYPPYAQGDGYLVSQHFVQCLVREVANNNNNGRQVILPVEDAYTGILAQACRVPCVSEEAISARQRQTTELVSDEFALEHKVKPMGMVGLHYFTCSSKFRHKEKSCNDDLLERHDGTVMVELPV